MKNRYYILGCLAALMGLMASLYSCTDELEGVGGTSTRPTDVVCFTASLSDGRTSSVSRGASGQLEIEQEEWLVGMEKKQDASRGAPVSLLSGSAGVIGYEYQTADDNTSIQLLSSLNKKQFNFDGDELTAESNDVRWSTLAGKDSVLFYAYAPFDMGGSPITEEENKVGPHSLAYTVKDVQVKDQKDLIVASWKGKKGEDYGTGIQSRTIPLMFEHALTAVKFKVGFPCTVTQLEVKGIYNSGTYTFGSGWSVNETSTDANVELTSDYEFTFGEDGAGKSFAVNAALTDGESTLMMIPQELPNGAEVVLTTTDNGTITIPLKGKVWQEGKMITYTIHKDQAPSYIYFDLAAGNVDIQKATSDTIKRYELNNSVNTNDIIYIGSIYVDGENKRYAGLHKRANSNKSIGNHYYVYQSSEANNKCNTKKHTGYESKNDFTDKKNCRIPSYAPVKYNGQLWSDFITNNKNDSLVFAVWDNVYGAGEAEADNAYKQKPNQSDAKGVVRDVDREATKNRIHITGNVDEVNLFIDNIYSSFQERGTVPVRNRTQGGISFIPSWDTGNSVLTINIIGDNRLGCVNYQNNSQTKNWLVFEGTGSLTVGDVDYYIDDEGYGSNRSCSVIGGPDTPTGKEHDYNIKFNSSVIYAGARKSGCTAIGGGGNGNTKITINGGTITAVTATTGTAIGGGSGLIQPGGEGDVTIKGGNIYAYNFRNRSNVPSSAIGGAGSKNVDGSLGKVGIHGGYVYAYSENGTAIGGGSSAHTRGGDAEITISGGQVIAVSGNGAGIGGGSACTLGYRYQEDKENALSYHGGTATIIINDSKI